MGNPLRPSHLWLAVPSPSHGRPPRDQVLASASRLDANQKVGFKNERTKRTRQTKQHILISGVSQWHACFSWANAQHKVGVPFNRQVLRSPAKSLTCGLKGNPTTKAKKLRNRIAGNHQDKRQARFLHLIHQVERDLSGNRNAKTKMQVELSFGPGDKSMTGVQPTEIVEG